MCQIVNDNRYRNGPNADPRGTPESMQDLLGLKIDLLNFIMFDQLQQGSCVKEIRWQGDGKEISFIGH